jgi:hypothetical protein
MLDRFAQLLHVSTAVIVIILLALAVQLAMQVYALVDLARRDEVFGGRKWVWALIIVLGNLIGAIGYLVAGRPAPPVDIAGSGASTTRGDAARRAVDELYGPRDER